MIHLNTNTESAATTPAATPPAAAPDSQAHVAPKPGEGGSTLNSQPLFPQSTGESDRAIQIASLLGERAASGPDDSAFGNGGALSDHLATLLDQAYSQTPPKKCARPAQSNSTMLNQFMSLRLQNRSLVTRHWPLATPFHGALQQPVTNGAKTGRFMPNRAKPTLNPQLSTLSLWSLQPNEPKRACALAPGAAGHSESHRMH